MLHVPARPAGLRRCVVYSLLSGSVCSSRDRRAVTGSIPIMFDLVEEFVMMNWNLGEHLDTPSASLLASIPSYNHFIALEFGTGGSLAYRLVPKDLGLADRIITGSRNLHVLDMTPVLDS